MQALNTPGADPHGAVVVMDGQIVGEGINRSVIHHDPTSHAETEAICNACSRKLSNDGYLREEIASPAMIF